MFFFSECGVSCESIVIIIFFGQVVLEIGLELAVLAHKRVLASFPREQVPKNEKFIEDFEMGQWDDITHL